MLARCKNILTNEHTSASTRAKNVFLRFFNRKTAWVDQNQSNLFKLLV